jgi:hypothetical protein
MDTNEDESAAPSSAEDAPATPAADADGEAPAEGAAADKESKEEPKKKKAKTHKQVPLTVKTMKPYVLDAAALNVLVETELQFKVQDQQEKEKNDARNALEEYIYEMRDKISSVYEPYILPADADAYRSTLTAMEDWLYDEGEDETKTVYVDKLAQLRVTGDAAEKRRREHEARPAAEERFRKTAVRYRKFLEAHAAGSEDYAHISAEQVAKVEAELAKQEALVNQKAAEQAKLATNVDAVLTVAVLTAAAVSLDGVCKSIVETPKPKAEPPKEEPAAPAEGEGAEGEAEQAQEEGAAGDAEPAMDLD